MPDEIDELIQHYRAAAESLRVLVVKCRQHKFEALAREAEEQQVVIVDRVNAFNFMRAKQKVKP